MIHHKPSKTKQKRNKSNNKKKTRKTTTHAVTKRGLSSASQPDRSGLKKLSTTPKSLSQLERLKEMREQQTQQELQDKLEAEKKAFMNKKADQASTLRGNKRVSDMLNNNLTEQQLKEINNAANVLPPPPHLTKPSHSPYFLPMWDPELANSTTMRTSFEKSTGLAYEQMNLNGHTLRGVPVELKSRLISKNKVSLVQIVSTAEPLQYANVAAEIWAESLKSHGATNSDGAITVEPTIINISEGMLYGLFLNYNNKKMADTFGEHVQDNVISFHIKKDTDPIARARRFLDCRNRFTSNLFLVDERGLIRWSAHLSTIPTTEFMEVLIRVTQDLILETQYDEADQL